MMASPVGNSRDRRLRWCPACDRRANGSKSMPAAAVAAAVVFGLAGLPAAATLAAQADGSIIAGGTAGAAANDSRWLLARFAADGTVDKSFGTDGMAENGCGHRPQPHRRNRDRPRRHLCVGNGADTEHRVCTRR